MNVLHNSNTEYFDLLSLPADYFEEQYFYRQSFWLLSN